MSSSSLSSRPPRSSDHKLTSHSFSHLLLSPTLLLLSSTLFSVVIVKGENTWNCFNSPACIKSDENPFGIPIWSVFAHHFWPSSNHPLGRQWTLSPDQAPDDQGNLTNFDLGYSMEDDCSKVSLLFFPLLKPLADLLSTSTIPGSCHSSLGTREPSFRLRETLRM